MKASLDSLEKKIGSAQLSCYYKDLYGDLQSLSRRAKTKKSRKRKRKKGQEDARNQLLSAAIRRRTSQPRWH